MDFCELRWKILFDNLPNATIRLSRRSISITYMKRQEASFNYASLTLTVHQWERGIAGDASTVGNSDLIPRLDHGESRDGR